MKDLRVLHLDGCDVTAEGLLTLKVLSELRLLDVAMTTVNDFTAIDLRKAFPRARVVFSSISTR